jgi:hypothetical protein
MFIQTYLHPIADNTIITEEAIREHEAFPLLRELTHKYGLKVISRTVGSNHHLRLLLADEQGFPIASIWKDRQTDAYNIRATMVAKDRGRHWEDKYTYYAKRISHLMKVIEKDELLPKNSEEFINRTFGMNIRGAICRMSEPYGEIRKSGHYFSGEEVHSLLKIVLNNRSIDELPKESIAKVKDTFDKYAQVDIMRDKRRTEMVDMFSKPMSVLVRDDMGFMAGKLILEPLWAINDESSLVSSRCAIAEPFKRIHDVDECVDLIPTLTMLKVYMQEKMSRNNDGVKIHHGESGLFTNIGDTYIPELRTVGFDENGRWTHSGILKSNWLFIHE